jgi:hypothetical protein
MVYPGVVLDKLDGVSFWDIFKIPENKNIERRIRSRPCPKITQLNLKSQGHSLITLLPTY